MSYSNGEGTLLATLRLHANYDANNTSRGNWRVLNSGKAAYYVILRPGPATFADESVGGGLGKVANRQAEWTTQLMVYHRYRDDGTDAINLQSRVDEIIAHLDKYRAGGSSAAMRDARVISLGQMEEVRMGADGPLYLRWIINVRWHEQRQVTYSE